MNGDIVSYYCSAFHDELDVLELADVGKRIAGDSNDIPVTARLD